jgi:hypothetical protein
MIERVNIIKSLSETLKDLEAKSKHLRVEIDKAENRNRQMECTIEQKKTLQGLYKEFIENCRPLDPEFSEIVNEHFWEMIADVETTTSNT